MDWALVIQKNREALIGIVAALFAQAGLVPPRGRVSHGFGPLLLDRPVRRAILRLLRPAEAALRRLVFIIAAQGVKAPAPRQTGAMPDFAQFAKASQSPVPRFTLVDPRKRFDTGPRRLIARTCPRISVPGLVDARFDSLPDAAPDTRIDAAALVRRINALHHALAHLPAQARRLARYQLQSQQNGARIKLPPLRPGHPPGHRARRRHAVDDVLYECQRMAVDLMGGSSDVSRCWRAAMARGPTGPF